MSSWKRFLSLLYVFFLALPLACSDLKPPGTELTSTEAVADPQGEEQAYIVGKTAEGTWAGLKTTVVETEARP